MTITKNKTDIRQYWMGRLRSWYPLFEPYVDKLNYFDQLINFINHEYTTRTIFPAQVNIYKPFVVTDYSNVKVIIVGQDPYSDGKATGIPFANCTSSYKFSPSLLKIEETIKYEFPDKMKYLQYDLESWCKQGVLLINSGMTVRSGMPGSHIPYWKLFIKILLQELNARKTGLIFCFWGNVAKDFKPLIETGKNKHYVLECEHPAAAVRENRSWNCDHFTKINKILSDNNGFGEEILW